MDEEEEKGCVNYYYAVIRKAGRAARGVVSTSRELTASALGVSSGGQIGTAGSIPECIQAMGRGPERVHPSCVDILQSTDSRTVSMHRLQILRESGDLVFDTPAERYAKGTAAEGRPETRGEKEVWLQVGPADPETWPTFQIRILRVEARESFRELALHVPEAIRPKTMRSRSRIGCAMLATVIGTVCKSAAGIRVTRIILSCPATYRALEVQARRWIRGLDAKTRTPDAEIVVDVRMALDALRVDLHLE